MSSTPSSSWQQDWQDAQPSLSSISRSLTAQSPPKSRILRVGQLDAELLDQELVHLLQEPLTKALSLINSSLRARFEPELSLIIQLTLYKLSIWNTGASYGAKLQDLRYTVPHSIARSLAPSGLPRIILLLHGTLTVLVPYLHNRLRSHALSHSWPDAPSSDGRRKAWELLTRLESIHTVLGLVNFVAFLTNGRYRTLADRLFGLSLVPSQRLVRRNVSYEFMNRQMVWHAFTEFLLFLLPLISVRTLRRRLTRFFSNLSLRSLTPFLPLPSYVKSYLGIDSSSSPDGKGRTTTPKKKGKYHSLSPDQCAICAENASYNLNISDPTNAFTSLTAVTTHQPSSTGPDQPSPDPVHSDAEAPTYPISTPYVTSCSHVYCYVCLAERMMRAADDGEIWECLRCGELVRSVDRLTGEETQGVEVEGEAESLDYEFSSDLDDGSELSGSVSMGSYTYSESALSDR
ncbi:hypothetical protein JAAARDRAFT_167135 [Jaapia argillacea MUCL 33604]|uniref:RING-type E3 ubiquitin transferase (cysteine targeting) n=1 Tax=Jaapia argillacea MUCL 33604 TaxID=933084 RepID=A0A067QEN2_9AGAM|nr:hypothetical protein JAAARDRAFT_167135 [Jaapia argillacea MUCL 33604]